MAKRKEIKDIKKRLSFEEAKDVSSNTKSPTNKTTKKNKKGRVKLTTTINPEIRDRLRILAIKKKLNLSDLIEKAILNFLDNQ